MFPLELFSSGKLPPVAARLTRDHQGHGVSLIVVIHDNLTVVSARVVGAETGDLHGSIQGIGSVSWQHDTATESLIHLDYVTFGTEKKVSSLKVSTGDTKSEERRPENVFSSIDLLSVVNRRLLSWTRAASAPMKSLKTFHLIFINGLL